eukprot:1158264-Pelagomonas_calceolata.AAC.3
MHTFEQRSEPVIDAGQLIEAVVHAAEAARGEIAQVLMRGLAAAQDQAGREAGIVLSPGLGRQGRGHSPVERHKEVLAFTVRCLVLSSSPGPGRQGSRGLLACCLKQPRTRQAGSLIGQGSSGQLLKNLQLQRARTCMHTHKADTVPGPAAAGPGGSSAMRQYKHVHI